MTKSASLWHEIAPLLTSVERPSRYIGSEFGSITPHESHFRFCMAYPDTYELGQANQAVRILTNAINATSTMQAQRVFLPAVDMCDLLRERGIPLTSLEECVSVNEFSVLGITLPHELAATNILELLDLSHIPLHACDRSNSDPIVIGGGPCALNPEPYAAFFDAFNIGEGEQSLLEGLQTIQSGLSSGLSRDALLSSLAQLEGWYVPSLYNVLGASDAQAKGVWVTPKTEEVPSSITRQIYTGFSQSDADEPCLVPYTEVSHDRLTVEILRGCARGCRFCQAGIMYRPVRERPASALVSAVKSGLQTTGYDEVSLTSLSTTDHSQIETILTQVNNLVANSGTRVSIPSQRVDAFGVKMAGLVAGQKKGGLTFAPEAGTQRLRDAINKNVTEEDLLSTVSAAFAAGWRRCKLYFMIGLPTETDEDVIGIAHLLEKVYSCAKDSVPADQRGSIRIGASLALFVPKPHTPFQWDGQISADEAYRRVSLVKHALRHKAITLNWHEPKTSLLEAVMSRAGRSVADLIELAWRKGARFDAWSEQFNEDAWRDAASDLNIALDQEAQRIFSYEEVLPWEHIDLGVARSWLVKERDRAAHCLTTEDCTFGACSGCGVCGTFSVANELASERCKDDQQATEDAQQNCLQTPQERLLQIAHPAGAQQQRTFRLRVSYTKQGRLAYLSHLEIARSLERIVRRAQLPYAVSQGYSPHMLIAYGSALPVGVGSTCEIFDIQLTSYLAADNVLSKLQDASGDGLEITSCWYIEASADAASVAFPISHYCADLSYRIDASQLVVPHTVSVVRKRKEKILVVEDYLYKPPRLEGSVLTFSLEAKQTGSLRTDKFLAACMQETNKNVALEEPLTVASVTRIGQQNSAGQCVGDCPEYEDRSI